MHRVALLGLLIVAFLLVFGAAVAGAQTTEVTTTAPVPTEGGTSPWVLVLIGIGAGAVVGVFTGLARRRRAQSRDGG
jgi:hypothetical protein